MLVFWLVVAGCLLVWAIWFFVDTLMRNSGATKAALKLVEGNIEVMNLLGDPLKIGFWISGSVTEHLGFSAFLAPRWRGSASLSLPLEGSRAEGRLKVKLEKRNGIWQPYFARIQIGEKSMLLIDDERPKGWLKRLLTRSTS